MLVCLVVVEPAGSHDRVWQAADAHETLAASLPIVRLRSAVVVALTVGHADGRHQGDAHRPAAKRGEHVANPAVVDLLRLGLATSVRAVCEHDRIHAIDRCSQRVRPCEIAGNHLHLRQQLARLSRIADKGPDGWPFLTACSTTRRPMLPVAPRPDVGLRDQLRGRVRLLVTPQSAAMVLAPKLAAFGRGFPDIVLEVTTTQRVARRSWSPASMRALPSVSPFNATWSRSACLLSSSAPRARSCRQRHAGIPAGLNFKEVGG